MASAPEIVKDFVIEFRYIDHLFARYARLCASCALHRHAHLGRQGLGNDIWRERTAPRHAELHRGVDRCQR
jgi:hypothetical protein